MAIAEDHLWITQEEANGVDGGSTTAATWVDRQVNTVKHNGITGASLSEPAITLPAGTYWAEIVHAIYNGGVGGTRLFNFTDSAVLLLGTNWFIVDRGENSMIRGEFTLAAPKDVRIQVFDSQSIASIGMGLAQDDAGHLVENYCHARFWRRA